MDGLKEAIGSIIKAPSGHSKMQAMHKVSKQFYFLCHKTRMQRLDILCLATEIIGIFTEDMKILEEKISNNSEYAGIK